jgi:hypothetical protein
MFLTSIGPASDFAGTFYMASDWENKLQYLLTDRFGQMMDNQERMQAQMKADHEWHYVTTVKQVTMNILIQSFQGKKSNI